MEILEKKRVAVVDDDPIFLEYVSSVLALEGGFRVETARSGEDLMELVQSQNFQCVVVDYDLGATTGLAIGRDLKASLPAAPPIVMLTGEGDERTAAKAFRIGFSDYVSKRKLDKSELIAAIRTSITQFERAAAEEEFEARIRERARHDTVTGLMSSGYMHAQLDELAKPVSRPLTLLIVSIRELTEVRRSFGYRTADRVQRGFAKRLAELQNTRIAVGHWDHDSFALMFNRDPDEHELAELEQRLRSQLTFADEFDRQRISLSPEIQRLAFERGMRPESEPQVRTIGAAAPDADSGQLKSRQTDEASTEPALLATESEERRQHHRHRVLKRGRIIVSGLNSSIDCIVRDLSDGGARLRVEGYFIAPSKFVLEVLGSGTRRPVLTRWQNGSDLGVQFEDVSQ